MAGIPTLAVACRARGNGTIVNRAGVVAYLLVSFDAYINPIAAEVPLRNNAPPHGPVWLHL
jgi:hypothetical protein